MSTDLLALQGGSSDALYALRCEAKRLRALSEEGGLSDDQFERLIKLFDVLSKKEQQTAEVLLGAVGLKLRFRNMDDRTLQALLSGVVEPETK